MTQNATAKISRPRQVFNALDDALTRLLAARPGLMVAFLACIGAGTITGHMRAFQQLPEPVAAPIRHTFLIVAIFVAFAIAVLAFTLGRLGFTLKEAKANAHLAETATSEVETQFRARQRVEKRLVEAEARLETSAATVEQWAGELERVNAKLRDVDTVKTRFLSQVAHELRGPISAMVSAAKIIQKHHDTKPEVVARFGSTIVTEGDRLNHVINDFVDLAKIESGCVQWQIENCEISEIVNRAILAVEPEALASGLILDTSLDEELPTLRSDADRITQATTNLLLHAIKCSTNGGTISLRAIRGDQHTRFEVKDASAGIPVDEVTHLFDRFHRPSNETTNGATRKRLGTGLGLAIAKEIVEHCGGKLSATSELGKGTILCFTLPDDTSRFIRERNQVLSVNSNVTQAVNVAVVTRNQELEHTLLRVPRGRGVVCRVENDAKGLTELLADWHPDCVVIDADVFEQKGEALLPVVQNHGLREVLIHNGKGSFSAHSVRDNSEIAVRRLRYLVNHGSRVLVVEDDDDYRDIITFELEHAGYKVTAARDGQEALEVLAAKKIDAIMLDVVVPRIDGLTVLRELNHAEVKIPTILLTGIEDPDVILEAKQLGALEVIHKHGVNDVTRAAVLARVQRLLTPVFADADAAETIGAEVDA